jgi:hypothetical protein
MSREMRMPPMMKMGGFKNMRAPPTFKMTNSRATLVSADQGEKYHPTTYGAQNALKNDNSFTHTKNKVGSWWKASFKGGQ